MCLKDTKKVKDCLKTTILRKNFEKYENIRQQGCYNMFDQKTRILTGLTDREYKYILANYTELKKKFKDIKAKQTEDLQHICERN